MSPYLDVTLCVPRQSKKKDSSSRTSNLANPTVVSSTIGEIPPNHLLLRVERFGFSTNNLTYGALGEDPHFLYFDFYPAPKSERTSPETHGVIPVWGFATVVETTHPSIGKGERVFGYFGMSRYVLVPLEATVNKYSCYIPRPHLPADRRPYNLLTRCNADPLYSAEREDETMIYRPLFWTAFWCEDWLFCSGLLSSAQSVVITSASSKTAYSLAFVIHLRRQFGQVALRSSKASSFDMPQNFKIIGLTSKRNLTFTESLNLYDEVWTYDNVNGLPVGASCIYIDVAGDASLNTRLTDEIGTRLLKGVSLGASHPTSSQQSPTATGFHFFFMPEWLAERKKSTTVAEITKLQADGWDALMKCCSKWLKIERVWGIGGKTWMEETKGVLEVYDDMVNGDVKPDHGYIFSMWDENGWIKSENVVAKL